MLKRRTWLIAAAPTNRLSSAICGHASRQQAHVMHVERTYRSACSAWLRRGPGPRLCVPSSTSHAFTLWSASNIRLRSTARSRTSGNLRSGSLALGVDRVELDLHQRGDHVGALPPGDPELLEVAAGGGRRLTPDAEVDEAVGVVRHTSAAPARPRAWECPRS